MSFTDVPTRHKVRELTTAKIGTLIRISGQVVRTHPVHPELVSGTFICLDCQTMIKDVEQQFKVPFVFAFPEDYNPFNIMVQNKASAILVSLLLGISSDAEPFFLPPPFPVIFVSSQLNHQKPQKERCYADLSILV